jgi:hypothetical protein
MPQRFACIATSRRRRALAASLSSHAVRSRRASASLRRSTGAWRDVGEANASLDRTDRQSVSRAPERNPLPAIISRR